MAGKSNILSKLWGKSGNLQGLLRQVSSYVPIRSWRRSSMLLAIELSSSAFKLMQLSKQGKAYRVDYYAIAPVPPDAVVDNKIKDTKPLTAVLQRVLERTEQDAKYVITALPSAMTITQKLLVELTKNEEILTDRIFDEAENVIPQSLDDMSLDYVNLGESSADPGKLDILLVASDSAEMADRLEIVEDAGLEVKLLDVDSYAMCRALHLIADQMPETVYAKGRLAVFDLGARNTTFNVISQQKPLYTHEETFGGDQLTEKIQAQYDLSYEQADWGKQSGDLPQDYEAQLLEPFKKTVVKHIHEMLETFYASSEHDSVDLIVLAGGVALTKGLAESIGQLLKIETIVADPCKVLTLDDNIDNALFNASSPALMSVLGLAMRGADI